MSESSNAISRRDVLKTTAKAAGAAAFVTPVVVSVFSSPALGAVLCPSTDSAAKSATVVVGPTTRNVNCAGSGASGGRYNAQDLADNIFEVGTAPNIVQGTLAFGGPGVDNFDVEVGFYSITQPVGWKCTATWEIENCDGNVIVYPEQSPDAQGRIPLPYCASDCSSVKLNLIDVSCCPV